jgi:segregation and condensation protein B
MDNIYFSIIEALIFASDEPIQPKEIVKAIKEIDGGDVSITEGEINSAVDALNEKYTEKESAFKIIRIANGLTFATKPEYAKYVGYLSTEKSKRRLSQAALETLAIIAYKQPITKPEIEMIRGVNSDYMLNTLLEKKLVTIQGRAETIGRPLLYATTDEFLKYFGLNNLKDLPKPREIEEIMKDEDFIEQKRKIMMNAMEEVLENETDLSEDGENGTAETE